MPELPEVETMRRGLEPAMLHQKIENVTLNRMDLRGPIDSDFKARMEGVCIRNIIRRGKYILVFLESGDGFVLHLGMSGRVHIYEATDDYVPAKHDHVIWNMGNGACVVLNDPRRFGMLYLTREQAWSHEAPFNKMGPEPLGNEFSGEALYGVLQNKRVPIKNALLDQRVSRSTDCPKHADRIPLVQQRDPQYRRQPAPLKQRGWTFVGPTTCYAFIQAMGLVNDHIDGCHIREKIK